jgi:phosphatidate cytidylyltransferase
MIIRSLSALVMAISVLSAIWMGSPYFEALIVLVGWLAIMEWYRLILVNRPKFPNIIFMCFGVLYVIAPCLILVWLRNNGPHGLYFIVWFFVVIWSTDIGAYLFGKSIGVAKLAPKISPNKTWAGFFGGIGSAVIVSLLFYYFLYPIAGLFLLFLGCVVISVVGQIGDLFESWCKRRLGVKDSGKLIPGHGGILDRVDSILLSAPIAGVVSIIFQTHEILF